MLRKRKTNKITKKISAIDLDGNLYTIEEYTFVIQSKARNVIVKETLGKVSYQTNDGLKVEKIDGKFYLNKSLLEITD